MSQLNKQTAAGAGKETRKSFETQSLADKYCKIMTLTSRNTTGWYVEQNGARWDAVGFFCDLKGATK